MIRYIFLGDKEKEILKNSNAIGIDVLLRPIVSTVKEDYKKNGDPLLILQTTSRLLQEIGDVSKTFSSLEYAKLLSVHGQMLLSVGKDEALLKLALGTIHESIEVCLSINYITEDINKELIKNSLIFAVILKALGDFDFSIRSMREQAVLYLNKRGGSKLELIPLQRQEVIMNQTVIDHKKLMEEAPYYKKLKPVEYYSTLKRILEFSMNNDMYILARRMFPEFKDSFKNIKDELPPLSHISFVKNVGQYFVSIGESQNGKNLLEYAVAQSEKLNLFGQSAQIKSLLNEIDLGEKVKLKTFKIV